MSLDPGGAGPHSESDRLSARRAHDLAALAGARGPAVVAMRALLRCLDQGSEVEPPHLEKLARAAHDATGLLWERAARLSE